MLHTAKEPDNGTVIYYDYYNCMTLTEWHVNILVTVLRLTSLMCCLIHCQYWSSVAFDWFVHLPPMNLPTNTNGLS